MNNNRTLFIAAHNGGTPEPMVPFEYSGSTERVPIVIDNGELTFNSLALPILPATRRDQVSVRLRRGRPRPFFLAELSVPIPRTKNEPAHLIIWPIHQHRRYFARPV